MLLACIFYGIALLVLLIVARSTDLVVLGAVVSLSLFSANLLGAFSAYFQSHLRMTMFLRSSLLCASFYVLASVLAIQYQLPITLVMAILPITEAFNVILLCRQVGWISPRIDFRQSVALVRESLPVGLMGAMIVLYFRIDSLIVFRIAGEAALGLYAVAYRIVEPILMVPHAFSLTAYAILSARKNQESSVSSLRIVIKAMWPAFVAVAIAASALVWGSGSLLSHILPDYIAAQALLQVLGVTLLVRTINLTLTAVINANGEYRALAKITGVNLCLNVGLALFLVPQWGALGAALSVLLTETANCAMQWTVVSSFGRLRQPTVGVPQVD